MKLNEHIKYDVDDEQDCIKTGKTTSMLTPQKKPD